MYSRELIKGILKPIILKLLEERGMMYGYEITQEVLQLSSGKIKIKEGSLYPILHSLKKEGILETESTEVNGRLRKYYRLSKKGKPYSRAAIDELTAFVDTLQVMLEPNPKTSHAS